MIRAFEATEISVVNYLITWLVSKVSKEKDTIRPPSWIFKRSVTS